MSDLPAFLAPILEDLASLRSSSARKLRALSQLDCLLATLCVPKQHETREEKQERTRVLGVFVRLQDGMEGNVVSRLLPLVARLLPVLHTQLVNKESDEVVSSTLTELSAVLPVVQGLALLHCGSRDLVGRRSSIEVILDLFLLTRHLPASTQPEPSQSSSSSTQPATPLASSLLDTLFCSLADSPVNTRVFEEAGGLETVMRVLKKPGVRKDVRMKCLEFLIFYLLPEPTSTPSSPSLSGTTTPSTLTPPASKTPLPPASPQSTSQTSTPHQDPTPLPSIAPSPSRAPPRTPTRRAPSGLEPSLVARTPSSSKHRAHGLGISSSFDHLPSSRFPSASPHTSQPAVSSSRKSSSSSTAAEPPSASDAGNLIPQSPSRRALAASQAGKAPRTPSRHAGHGLGISNTQPPSPSSRTASRSASTSRPLQPTSTSNATVPQPGLEAFVPQTPVKRRDGAEALGSNALPRTPSRYRMKDDADTTPVKARTGRVVSGKGRVASLSGGDLLSADLGVKSDQPSRRRESGLMLPPPPPQRSSSGSTPPLGQSSSATAALKQRSSTPSFRLQPPPPPSPSHQQQDLPSSTVTSASSLTPRRPSSSASSHIHPSPLLPLPASPASSHQPSPNPNPNTDPSTPTKVRRPKSSKPFDLSLVSPQKKVPATAGTTRSVEEKKALLGTFLANVDSLLGAFGGAAEMGGMGMLIGQGKSGGGGIAA